MTPSNDLHRLAMRLFAISGQLSVGYYPLAQHALKSAELELKNIYAVVAELSSETGEEGHGLEPDANSDQNRPGHPLESLRGFHSRYRPKARNSGLIGWWLHPWRRDLTSPDGRTLELTQQESRVLTELLRRPGDIVERHEICTALGCNYLEYPETRLNTLMCRLRQKLAEFDQELRIQTWRNRGYSFTGPVIKQYEQ